MSTDNLYEIAGEYETLSLDASEILQKYGKKAMPTKDIELLREMLQKMENS